MRITAIAILITPNEKIDRPNVHASVAANEFCWSIPPAATRLAITEMVAPISPMIANVKPTVR